MSDAATGRRLPAGSRLQARPRPTAGPRLPTRPSTRPRLPVRSWPAMLRPRLAAGVAVAVLAAVALALRVHTRQKGLMYPDGYQYLLMARGIATHLTPTVQLGKGGELFVPSIDAALKPLFPALIAAFSRVAGARAAADAIAAVAGAATVVLAALLAGRLTGSRASAAVAAVAVLASPAIAYWSGFAGPDPLADALVLACALAVVCGRGTLAGLLGGLCAATRPEWALVLTAAGFAGLASPSTRALAGRSLLTAAFVLAAIVAVLRPPLAVPLGGLGLVFGGLAAGTAMQLAAHWAGGVSRRATFAAAAALLAMAAPAVAGRAPALTALARGEWPLLALGAWGTLRACAGGRGRPALILLASIALAAAAYGYRNAGSERYLAELLPLVCVAGGFAVAVGGTGRVGRFTVVAGRAGRVGRFTVAAGRAGRVGRFTVAAGRAGRVGSFLAARSTRPVLVAGAVALALLPQLTAPPRPRLAADEFAALAGRLAKAPQGPLVSVSPDAYGFLLPGRPEFMLRPGARGLILLDGAQRAYAPDLTARGTVVARLTVPDGFQRPDGGIDRAAVLLVRGTAVYASVANRP
jgi:hypothetical protein